MTLGTGAVLGKPRRNFSVSVKGSKSLNALMGKKCDVSIWGLGKEKRLGN